MAIAGAVDNKTVSRANNRESTYFARFGYFLLSLKSTSDDAQTVHGSLVRALREDNRVKSVDAGSANHEWTISDIYYPTSRRAEIGALLSGSDHFHSLRFTDAILFEVFVPAKNQPVIHGVSADADSYLVAWDGCTAVVMWHRDPSEVRAKSAAGQVIADVLEEACSRAGHALYVQACNPACRHLFAHKDIKVEMSASDDYSADFLVEESGGMQLRMTGGLEGLGLVEAAHDELKVPASAFAEVKNVARRILDLEHEARGMALNLIEHDYISLRRSQEGSARRAGYFLNDLWRALGGRGRGKEAKLLIASLWLAMASMENLQQSFRDAERRYAEAVSDWARPELFDGDLKSDEASVGSIDSQFARAAIDHKSTRMDNRIVVWATLGGAVIGAVIAAAASGVLA